MNDPDDKTACANALQADKLESALQEVWGRCFRPAFKHGYADIRINAIIDAINARMSDVIDADGVPIGANTLIEALGQLYWETLNDNNVKLE
jgi:hypothetical protein